jgi:hypothetical protein
MKGLTLTMHYNYMDLIANDTDILGIIIIRGNTKIADNLDHRVHLL